MRPRNRPPSHRFQAFALVGLALVVVFYGVTAYARPLPVLTGAPEPATPVALTKAALVWPGYGAAAVGAAGFGVLAANGDTKPLPTASIAKVMAALAVLKKYPLQPGQPGPTLTLTQADAASYATYAAEDGSVARVVAGERITERQALEAMLLPSANNMADSLARWAFGSVSAYCTYANSLAKSLGMHDSNFGPADASGFAPTTTATAHDLVLLGLAAEQNPALAQIASEKTATVPVAGTVRNVNWLLGMDGITGIKTGNNAQDPGAFLFSSTQTVAGGRHVDIVGVVMGAGTLNQAMAGAVPLLKSTAASFHETTLVQAGQVVGRYKLPWAGSVDAVAAKQLAPVTWPGISPAPKISLNAIRAPLAKGAAVGTVAVPGQPSLSTPVILAQPISTPSFRWRLSHSF